MANRERIALIFLVSLLASCKGGQDAAPGLRLGALTADAPVGWKIQEYPEDHSVSVAGPRPIGMYRPRITITKMDRPVTQAQVQSGHSVFSRNAGNAVSPVEAVTVGNLQGWGYTRRYINMSALTVHNPNPPAPTTVEHIDREYELNSPEGSYSIRLSCPEPLKNECEPVFERFLKSLHVTAQN